MLQRPRVPDELDFDPAALRERYRAERERRVRPDGARQYRRAEGAFGYYAEDPYAAAGVDREPLYDRVDAVVIGGGFGGLCAGARLRQAGLERIRIVEKGGDVGGTWYWNRYPGIHCDIESHVYLPLLEEAGSVPEWKYAPGEEIRRADRRRQHGRRCTAFDAGIHLGGRDGRHPLHRFRRPVCQVAILHS